MNKHEIARKLIKMAKSLIGYRSDPTITGISSELADVDEVVIIITDAPLYEDMSRFASGEHNSIYSLKEVKELISYVPSRITFNERDDDLSNPVRLGIDKQEAIEIISNLTEAEYSKQLSRNFIGTDVYLVENYVSKQGETLPTLYIKFKIEGKKNKRKILVISFHEKDLK